MTDIKPNEEDVKIAYEILNDIGIIPDDEYEGDRIAMALATARLQERERCAKICDVFTAASNRKLTNTPYPSGSVEHAITSATFEGGSEISRSIAQIIRSQP